MAQTILRLGTRGSMLAMAQAATVARAIEKRNPGLTIETVIIKTTGDVVLDRPLYELGGKGLFVKEIEQALLDGKIDLAVHSAKDLPVTMPLVDQAKLTIAAVPKRGDPRDALVCKSARQISELSQGARVATGSLRRKCQLLSMRGDLRIEPIRGNIDTRLKKIQAGEYDAGVLAMSGLERSDLFDETWMYPIPIHEMTPAAGQGTLAIQSRAGDSIVLQAVADLDDQNTRMCLNFEREIVQGLECDCHSPIGVYARISGLSVDMFVAIGRSGGDPPVIRAEESADDEMLDIVPRRLLKKLQNPDISLHLHGR